MEHDLFTDSSAARQLALRQAKHIAGKLLWIQDIVQSGQTMLVQILTVWNLADIGTKTWTSKKRIKVLLHEPCMCEDEGAYLVGQTEFEEQSAKHGSGRDLTVLAKSVLRILLMMGLGPTGAWNMVLHDDGVDADQCKLEQPNAFKEKTFSIGTVLGMVGIFVLVIVAWNFALTWIQVAQSTGQTIAVCAYKLQG